MRFENSFRKQCIAAIVFVGMFASAIVSGCDSRNQSRHSVSSEVPYGDGANYSDSNTMEPEAAKNSKSIRSKQVSTELSQTVSQRKLVYSGEVVIEVETFEEFAQKLTEELSRWNGFIGSSNESRADTKSRSAVWTLRIPVEQFDEALQWLDKNYYILDKKVQSKDVTEEYSDLDARLANKRNTELRLIEHLSKTTSKLDEILLMERELDRVREEIERIEGRLKYLRDVTQLSTLIIRASTKQEFASVKAPSATSRFWSTFSGSWKIIGLVLFVLVDAAIGLFPFALVLGAIIFVVYKRTGLTSSDLLNRIQRKDM